MNFTDFFSYCFSAYLTPECFRTYLIPQFNVSYYLNILFITLLLFRKLKRHNHNKINSGPYLETFENILKLGSLIIQQLSDLNCSPLLQLPHICESDLKHFTTKRRRIHSLDDIANLTEEERLKLLRHLSQEEYLNVFAVLSGMPKVNMQVELEIVDIKDSAKVTPGALVTVNVYLTRTNLLSPLKIEDNQDIVNERGLVHDLAEDKVAVTNYRTKNKRSIKGYKKSQRNVPEELMDVPFEKINSNKFILNRENRPEFNNADEDKEFELLQETILKKHRSKLYKDEISSFPVHCPHFYHDKQEGWWLYMSDHKSKSLIAAPKFISCLINNLVMELKFQAPFQIGQYHYEVSLISDSYIGVNCKQPCVFTVYPTNLNKDDFDYGLDDHDKENSNDFIEQDETTSTEESHSDDSVLDDF